MTNFNDNGGSDTSIHKEHSYDEIFEKIYKDIQSANTDDLKKIYKILCHISCNSSGLENKIFDISLL